MTTVRLEHLFKSFGRTRVLDDIELRIESGELFFLLGPSGCGKSTLLRLIAGLHEPTRGRIFFNDRDVTDLGTQHRNAVMCFQSYALWPHMNVRDNVRFGLDVRKTPADEAAKRVHEVLALAQIDALADRKPSEISGGQQQRVALARALAVHPACLLLDEPLSNLDAKLRIEMRAEIRRICKSTGITTIYVTHDQKEALSVADRIAILHDGRLAQVGSPGALYNRPASAFVASFIGQTNLIDGTVGESLDGMAIVATDAGAIRAPRGAAAGAKVTLSIRPEQMRIARDGGDGGGANSGGNAGGANRLSGRVIETTFLGEASEHVLEVKTRKIKVIVTPPLFEPPPELTVAFDAADVVVLDRSTPVEPDEVA
jgi:iron(III) transport system ATP-binding protein